MARWHSFDKQDWCFRGPGFIGTGFLVGDKAYDNSPAHFLVWGFTEKFTTAQLHQLLWLTKAQFPNVELWCEYRKQLGTQVDELAAQGHIKRHHLSMGKVHVTEVNMPVSAQPSIHYWHQRAWRWFMQWCAK